MAVVYAGMVAWPVEMGSEIAHAYREWLASTPDEMTAQLRFLTLPPIPELPDPLRGKSLVDVTGAFIGDLAEGEQLMRPLREIDGAVWDTWGVQPAAELRHLALDPEQPVPGVGDHVLLDELTPEAVDVLVGVAGADSGSPLIGVQVRQLGGALGRDADGAGALPRIDAEHGVFGVGAAFDPASRAAVENHLDRLSRSSCPTRPAAARFADRPGDVSAAPGRGLAALLAIKQQYDPGRPVRGRPPGGLRLRPGAARTRRGCGRRG